MRKIASLLAVLLLFCNAPKQTLIKASYMLREIRSLPYLFSNLIQRIFIQIIIENSAFNCNARFGFYN
jgi:hypothetical protein